MHKHTYYILSFLLCCALTAQAVNQSYYSSLDGKKDEALREALTQLLYEKHTTFIPYNWDFPYDYDNDGNLLDIYSDCGFNNHNTYPSSYKCCCDAVNREHVVCQSNFGGNTNKDKVPQYSDRHHLYPVDGRANGHRSDLPFGECSGGVHGTCGSASTIIPGEGTSTCANHEYGKSGASNFSVPLPSGGGKVYEVGDEYKGDIARAILYMVVRYATKECCRLPDGAKNATPNLNTPNDYPVTAWANVEKDKVGQMFSSSLSTNHGLSDYGKALLLQWHRRDPVSQKEIDRNNGIEAAQGNRNPFVDYPCLVEYLWGDHTSEAVVLSSLVGSFEESFSGEGCSAVAIPSIVRPTSDIAFGATNTNIPIQKSVTIQGANLTADLSLAITGTNASFFSLSVSSITKEEATAGKAVTITYLPTSGGEHTATLRISDGGLSSAHEVVLSGSCCEQYTLTLVRNGQAEHLVCCGEYLLPTAETEKADCAEWTFQGWITDDSYNSTTKPSFTTSVDAATTLYAVYGQTAGGEESTSDFVLLSGTLTEGDYIFYYGEKAMKAKLFNSRLSYNEVSVTNNTITTTEDSIIWHIAPKGNYWTIYNSKTKSYAAGTGQKNQIQLLGSDTTNHSLWTANTKDKSYDFVNLHNTENNVNAYLRNNNTYGFACYASDFGSTSVLYKRVSTTSTTYKTSPCSMYSISYADEDGIATGGQYFISATSAVAGTVITLEEEAQDGYSFDGWVVTKADDPTVHVLTSNGQFEMPEYDVVVKASFSAIPTYTATWMANGVRHSSQTGLYYDQTPEMPATPDSCSESRLFAGWTTQAEYEDEADAPTDLFTTTAPPITDDVTFYAVYMDKETKESTESSDFIRFNGALTEGDYILYYGGKAMKARVSKNRLSYNEVSVINNTITSTEDSIIWHIAPNGDYWTIYNTAVKKYAAGNPDKAGKNQCSLSDTISDFAQWTCNTNHIEYDFENKGRAALDSDQLPENRFLRNNGTYGFACYSQQTGDSLLLYKRESSIVTVYSHYSLYCTKATYTVNFMSNGTLHATSSGHAGEAIEEIATPTTCDGYTFVGWSTHHYAVGNTDFPALDYTGRIPAANTTYYAVFSNVQGGASALSDDYKQISLSADLTTGNYVITGYNEGYFALSTTTKDSYYLAGVQVTPNSDNIISQPAEDIIWRITVNGEDATLYNATKGYLYIVQNNDYYNMAIGDNTTENGFSYSVSNDNWLFTSISYPTRVLEYYKDGARWAYYSKADAPVYLFKQQYNSEAVISYTTAPSCHDIPTELDQSDIHAQTVKILRNGQLVILRAGKTYTILGTEIR